MEKYTQVKLLPSRCGTTYTFRCGADDVRMLKEIAKFYGISCGEVIRRFIATEYDNINGNPKLKEAMEKLQDINNFLNTFSTTSK